MCVRIGACPLIAALVIGEAACGGGRPNLTSVSGGNSTVTVHLSVGTPLAGATVTVYAARDDNGAVNTQVGSAGVIGIGGPTDSSGGAKVVLSMQNYAGPIQVIASGSNLSYVDPSTAAVSSASGQNPTSIQIPAGFIFSSFYPNYSAGTEITVPVNLLTTLADHEALAYARGLHPLHPGAKTLSAALSDRDRLFVTHITTSASAWAPTTLRTTIPADLSAGPQTLDDTAYAAFFDVALNSLGHATATAAGYPTGSTAINAITLAQLLEQDVDADGIFDGRGAGGVQLATAGTTPIQLSSQFLRIPLAQALDQWIQSKSGNASGIAQADLVSSGVYAAISEDSTDLFGGPPVGLFNPTDRTPPELSFVTQQPKYMQAPNGNAFVNLAVNASDPSGVVSVFCASSSASSPVTAIQQSDGTWSCSVAMASSGPTQITIWGVDGATPPNSGQGLAPPYQLSCTVVVDNTPPLILYVGGPTYFDERGMSVGMTESVATVPPVYNYASSTKTAVATGGSFYKVATRVGWATAPAVADLEGENGDNIPFLQYSVPYDSQTDAPIATASYTVSIPDQPDVTGSLWPSAQTSATALFYDLPLSSNLIPALTTLTAPGTLSVAVTLTDAAGNTGTRTDTFAFTVIGPPVGAVEDTSYSTAGDVKSTYPYTIVNGDYAMLYDAAGLSTFLPEGEVRLTHYIITNPAPYSVAVGVSLPGGAWSSSETWPAVNESMGNSATYQLVPSSLGTCGLPVSPCASSSTTIPECYVPPGSSSWDCGILKVLAGYVTDESNSSLSTVAYYQLTGANPDPAVHSNGGNYIVPAASDGNPGLLSLYVARPQTVTRTIPISGSPPYIYDWGQQYSLIHESYCTCTTNCVTPGAQLLTGYYSDTWLYNQLATASETFDGEVQLATSGLNGTFEFGEITTAQAFALNMTVDH